MTDTRDMVRLATWLSPAFPIGAFSYSHGLECMVTAGRIGCSQELADWLDDLLRVGSAWSDAVLFAEAWRAVRDGDGERLAAVAELGEALAPGAERLAETMEQGTAFLKGATAWAASQFRAPYPVAVASVCAAHGVDCELALAAWLHAFAANQVSAGIRLVPLGQSDGLAVLARLEPLVLDSAARAARSTLDDLGTATIMADIAAMNHETQHSRLFRS